MLTGSFASAFHGSPRTTQDIDIVAASIGFVFLGLSLAAWTLFVNSFASSAEYVSPRSAQSSQSGTPGVGSLDAT